MSSERRRASSLRGRPGRRDEPMALVLSALLLLSLVPWKTSSAAEEAKDSCEECHGQASFLVTNKKLYDYFQRWSASVHKQEEVSCFDCHAGNRRASNKDKAHGRDLDAAAANSAVNFRNIPKTCGGCHRDIYDGFRQSSHFDHVVSKKQEDQGPTCVTCHGSLNVAVLNVNTVEEVCRQCHNEETGNSPDNPQEARALLNRFLSIHRYYRYIRVRSDAAETKPFFDEVDAQLDDLSVAWHTFDLDEIGEKTAAVLQALKAKRQEVSKASKQRAEDLQPSAE